MKTSLRPVATPSPQRRSPPPVKKPRYPKTRPSGQHPRRRFLALTAGAAALPAISRIANAQTYPTRHDHGDGARRIGLRIGVAREGRERGGTHRQA